MEGDDEINGSGGSYTTEFRQYDPVVGRWWGVDPLSTNFPWQSPYIGFDGNPIFFSDPFGDSTFVNSNKDGTYNVTGGNLIGDDRGVYVLNADKERERIGETLFTGSFFNYDKNSWVEGATIDLNDKSHQKFLDKNDNLEALGYLLPNPNNYDYKAIRDGERSERGNSIYNYRGARLDNGLIASARDVGNIQAGKSAGNSGLSWLMTKRAFKMRQGMNDFSNTNYTWVERIGRALNGVPETKGTVQAERYGWEVGIGRYREMVNSLSPSERWGRPYE